MKRTLLIALAVLAAAGIAVAGVAYVRPNLLPAWARNHLARPAGPAGDGEAAGLYCKEHGVPERFCTLCHGELKKTLLLCKEHGDIPEDICTLCHPETQKKHNIEMCPSGHGLPKHFCTQCGKSPSASALSPDDGWCADHNKPELLCDQCAKGDSESPASREKVKVCRRPLPVVRFASSKIARQIGVQTAVAKEETHSHKLSANAETAYDANHYAEICPRVGGFLRDVKVDLGQAAHQGDVLAVVDSAEVSGAKAQYLTAQAALKLAQATAERTQSLTRSGAVAAKAELEVMTALNQAQASVMDSEQKLRNLGFGDTELAEVMKTKDTRNLLNVVSPIDGTVVLRHAVKGEAVQATTQVFAVADTSKMWLWIDVYEADIDEVKLGQPVSFTVSGADARGAGYVALGEVTWVGTEVNDRTRTTRVRAELANRNGHLRAKQFGQAEIQVGSEHQALVVPKEAVQRKDNVDLVFLPQDDGSYRPQRVVTKPTDRADTLEVTWGLKAGQKVVTKGSFLLKTEIMKGAIGAGCCE